MENPAIFAVPASSVMTSETYLHVSPEGNGISCNNLSSGVSSPKETTIDIVSNIDKNSEETSVSASDGKDGVPFIPTILNSGNINPCSSAENLPLQQTEHFSGNHIDPSNPANLVLVNLVPFLALVDSTKDRLNIQVENGVPCSNENVSQVPVSSCGVNVNPETRTQIPIPNAFQNLHALAQANLIAQTQESIYQQLALIESSDKVEIWTEASDSPRMTPQLLQVRPVERHESPPKQTQESVGKSQEPVLFVCNIGECRRSFRFLRDFNNHRNNHKYLQCSYEECGRKFTWPAHLKYHMLTHSGDRKYKCKEPDCGKLFYTAQRLRVHVRTHSGEKPFKCSKCDKGFTTQGNLKNHIRTHTGEKPYVCKSEGCGRSFAEYSSLRKHVFKHTGDKPFKCNICSKAFSQSSSCRAHMKRHERDKLDGKEDNSATVGKDKAENLNVVEIAVDGKGFYEEFPQTVSGSIVTVETGAPHTQEKENCTSENRSYRLEQEEDTSSSSQMCSANVVVLSQPESTEPVTGYYHTTDAEEIVYSSELLDSELDHEEVAHGVSGVELTVETIHEEELEDEGPLSPSTHNMKDILPKMYMNSIDPIMELDDETGVHVMHTDS